MISSLVLVLQFLCLSLWIGGSAVLRFVVVPGSIPGTNEVTNEELISLIMGKYRRLLLPVLLFLVLTLFIQLVVLTHALGGKLRISIALVSIAALLETYVRFALFPRLQKLAATEHRRPPAEGRKECSSASRHLPENPWCELFSGHRCCHIVNFILHLSKCPWFPLVTKPPTSPCLIQTD